MDIVHETWFWVVVIGAPLVSALGLLARLARKEPPIELPPGVVPQPYAFDEEEEDDWGKKPEQDGGQAEEAGSPPEGNARPE
ncbi:hypothetical protein [Pseudogulbenkiania sp. MAI-1]|uniref:hypothetical protein n=1 Tax=Pseudogulbenkiania sp. MAI-1 TaxID=990370 RepID=UPI00045E6E26|nr:hypothetical protein [Pseudogulbenkiania sp. MAI-1]